MLPGMTANLPGFAGSSAASATGGTIGGFNFAPKSGINPWLIGGLVALGLVLLLRK